MKKIILSSLALIALSSCASDKGDVNKGAVKTEDGQKAVNACLDLNGKYVLTTTTEQGEVTSTLDLATKVVDGKTSYQFSANAEFLVADGETRAMEKDGEKGTIKVSCSADSVEVEKVPEGKTASTAKYTTPAANQLKVDATGDLASISGIYTKAEVAIAPPAPMPAPAPEPQPTPVMGCPEFNGKYSLKTLNEGGEHTQSFEFVTKVENGVTSYASNAAAQFITADGQPKEIEVNGEKATITLTCEPSALSAVVAKEGKETVTVKYTLLEDGKVKLEGTGEAAGQNGVYTKE